jgi:serine/threonine protein phosphatase PrpC
LASDGLWDVVQNAEVARSIRYAHGQRGVSMAQVPRALVHLAVYKRRSGDNTTVMIVPLYRTPLKQSVPKRKRASQKKLTYKDLYELAKRRNLPGRSRMRKAELARKLSM